MMAALKSTEANVDHSKTGLNPPLLISSSGSASASSSGSSDNPLIALRHPVKVPVMLLQGLSQSLTAPFSFGKMFPLMLARPASVYKARTTALLRSHRVIDVAIVALDQLNSA
jgi:hypothetical protein